jgi:hypothetical protein
MRRALLVILFFSSLYNVSAQCPSVYDYNGNVVTTPYWFGCSGGNFLLNLQPSGTWNNYTVDWGDGSATSYVITHGLNSRDVIAQVYRVSAPYDEVEVDIERGECIGYCDLCYKVIY